MSTHDKARPDLEGFAVWLINEWVEGDRGGVEFDGFEMQDMLTKFGILQKEQRTVPCDESCNCGDYGGAENGEVVDCYVLHKEVFAKVNNDDPT